MDITKILTELRTERARIDQAIAAIESINSTGRRRGRPAGVPAAPKRRRKRMSAVARRRLSMLLKQRWAQGKMKPRAEAKPAKTANPARHMSAAARNKIAAAQRARWAKWRKGKKAA